MCVHVGVVCVSVYVHTRVPTCGYRYLTAWRSEDNSWESSPPTRGLIHQTLVIKFPQQALFPLSHLSSTT